ncbi:MAG: NAD-dependent epimerase/dehydratase family protein [Verrucomicrobia bacterium]|nr:NAD-dependent epimerase/dehydratase family protein [Verrucomicrobiota bacterium]
MRRSVLIAGCGFVGLPLARNFVSSGWETHAITASESSAANLQGEAFRVHAANISERTGLKAFADHSFDVVIHCASSGRGDVSRYAAVFLAGTQNLMAHLDYRRLIFCSSTSVYAQTDGSWVDENSPANSVSETSQVLRKTEDMVLASGGTVTRLAGLYGPGRCVSLQRILEGRAAIQEDGKRVVNSLHQLDAAHALRFLAEAESSGLFNVVDNRPVTEMEWFHYVCERLNKPLPPRGPRDYNRKRGWSSKQVSNKKLRSLAWEPIYPTFKDGLDPLLRGVGT